MPKIEELLNNWKTILTSFVAVLVIVPSVLNSVTDIWVAWNDLPIGEKEKINSMLFKNHWKENPVHSKQLIVEIEKGKTPITLDIYRNGDIFIDYGRFTQWFPYKDIEITSNNFHLIPTIQAGFFSKFTRQLKTVNALPTKVTNEKKSNNEVVRSKTLSDGSIERQVININTGKVKSHEVIPAPVSSVKPANSVNISIEPIEVIKIPENSKGKVEIYNIDWK